MQIERETFLLLSSFLYSRKWKLRVSVRKAPSVLASIIRGVCGSTPGSDPCRSVCKHWGWPTVLEAAEWMNITILTSLRCRVRQRYSVLLMVVIKVSSLSWGAESKKEKERANNFTNTDWFIDPDELEWVLFHVHYQTADQIVSRFPSVWRFDRSSLCWWWWTVRLTPCLSWIDLVLFMPYRGR